MLMIDINAVLGFYVEIYNTYIIGIVAKIFSGFDLISDADFSENICFL